MSNRIIDNFLTNLHPEEKRTIEKYIKSNFSIKNGSVTLRTFKRITRNELPDVKDESSTNKIKSRLLEMSLDALMLENFMVEEVDSEIDQAILKLKKQIIQCKILQRSLTPSKGEIIKHLLNNIISESKKKEIYNVLIEALFIQKFFIGIRNGAKDYEKINLELNHYENCYKSLASAIDKYYRIILSTGLGLHLKNRKETLYAFVIETENDFVKTQSQNINYYLQILRAAHYEELKEFGKAKECYLNLVNIIRNYKYTYRKERIGFVYDNLIYFNVHMGLYKDAISSYKTAKRYFLSNTFNDLICTEQGYLVYFYNKNYSSASTCLNKLLSHSTSNTGRFRKSKYVYYKACLQFVQGKFKEAQVLLREPLEIEKDKTRWNISLRILNIMIFIELGKKNEAARASEALRKFLERTRKVDELKPRDILISKLLKEIEKNDFFFNGTNSVAVKLFLQLSEKESEVAWEHYTSELIPFHNWLEGKRVENKPLAEMVPA